MALWVCTAAQSKSISAPSDETIIEKLAPRLSRSKARSYKENDIRQAIALARQTSDPRYLGQAQAMMGRLWGSADASHEMATLQATIEQSRHEFDAARKTLQLALEKPAASKAQAWLTLASIERVQGRYAQAEQACKSIREPSAWAYARVCSLENLSLTGQSVLAREGYTDLLRQMRLPSQQAWIASLMAENELRSANPALAFKHFAFSLSLDADAYTAIAYADALIDSKQFEQALLVLQEIANSDAALLRKAMAYEQLNDSRLNQTKSELLDRFSAKDGRAAAAGHARESALFYWRVQKDYPKAWQFAEENLRLQREPIDWQIALGVALAIEKSAEHRKLMRRISEQGLKDSRLK